MLFEYFGLIPKISQEKLEHFESNLKLGGHFPELDTVMHMT